jgi:hypothetical protein
MDSASGERPVDWMDEIASESVLRQAYAGLCDRRRDHSPHDDVPDASCRWKEIRPLLQAQLRVGGYRLSPVRRCHRGDDTIEVWSALDAVGVRPAVRVPDGHGGKRTTSPFSDAAAPPPGLTQPREPRKPATRTEHRRLLPRYVSPATASPASGGPERTA